MRLIRKEQPGASKTGDQWTEVKEESILAQ